MKLAAVSSLPELPETRARRATAARNGMDFLELPGKRGMDGGVDFLR